MLSLSIFCEASECPPKNVGIKPVCSLWGRCRERTQYRFLSKHFLLNSLTQIYLIGRLIKIVIKGPWLCVLSMTEPSYVRKSLHLVFFRRGCICFHACLLFTNLLRNICIYIGLKEQPLKILCIIYLCTATYLLTEGPH